MSKLIDGVWTTLSRPLIGLLNMLFRPDRTDGAIAGWRIVAWIAVNCAVLFGILASPGARMNALFVGLFLLLHILIVVSSLRVMSEEKKVLEGSMTESQMTFSVYDAVNSVSLLSVSILFYVLGLPALIGLVEDGGIARILSKRPPIGIPYLANLSCVLNEIPGIGPILYAAANLSGLSPNLNADIVYSGIVGNLMRLVIVATVCTVIVSAIVLRLQQASHRAAILRSIEDRHGSWDLVHTRMLRVPRHLSEKLRHLAGLERDSGVRHRIGETLRRLGHALDGVKGRKGRD